MGKPDRATHLRNPAGGGCRSPSTIYPQFLSRRTCCRDRSHCGEKEMGVSGGRGRSRGAGARGDGGSGAGGGGRGRASARSHHLVPISLLPWRNASRAAAGARWLLPLGAADHGHQDGSREDPEDPASPKAPHPSAPRSLRAAAAAAAAIRLPRLPLRKRRRRQSPFSPYLALPPQKNIPHPLPQQHHPAALSPRPVAAEPRRKLPSAGARPAASLPPPAAARPAAFPTAGRGGEGTEGGRAPPSLRAESPRCGAGRAGLAGPGLTARGGGSPGTASGHARPGHGPGPAGCPRSRLHLPGAGAGLRG